MWHAQMLGTYPRQIGLYKEQKKVRRNDDDDDDDESRGNERPWVT